MAVATGIIRRVDDLGRVVIPKELRTTLNIPEGTPMEFLVKEDTIIIQKYQVGCRECGETETELHGNTKICGKCITTMYMNKFEG
jgi:AbrB family transcriptional regulator, transcriptional pleiotropic regulator of transition state genes